MPLVPNPSSVPNFTARSIHTCVTGRGKHRPTGGHPCPPGSQADSNARLQNCCASGGPTPSPGSTLKHKQGHRLEGSPTGLEAKVSRAGHGSCCTHSHARWAQGTPHTHWSTRHCPPEPWASVQAPGWPGRGIGPDSKPSMAGSACREGRPAAVALLELTCSQSTLSSHEEAPL